MRLTVRDGLPTLFVAAASVIYALWVTGRWPSCMERMPNAARRG